jgi:hypothetical protein
LLRRDPFSTELRKRAFRTPPGAFFQPGKHLVDLAFGKGQRRRQRDGVAGDADHHVLIVEGVLHRRESAGGRLAFDGREVDAGNDAAGADVLDDLKIGQMAVRGIGEQPPQAALPARTGPRRDRC